MSDPARLRSIAPDPVRSVGDATTDPGETNRTGPYIPGEQPAADAPTLPGYEILGELGRGGMGVVWKARHVALNRPTALKMILAPGRADAKEVVRFFAEAEAVAAVPHPNVVGVYEFGEADGRPFLALELCTGGSLAQRLKAGRLAPRAAAETLRKLAAGVAAAHALGIVHRDLKPGNVLFDDRGEPKVSDFGLAKKGAGADLTGTQAVMGTPAYMSPEQAKGETKFVGPQADVWSLGVILYECLTGKRPFVAEDSWALLQQVMSAEPVGLRTISRDIPRDLDLICRKCMAKAAHERYPTATELADDLGRYLDGKPILARPAGVIESGWKWARRNKPAVAVILALAGMAGLASWQAVRANEEATNARAAEGATARQLDLTKAAEETARGEEAKAKAAQANAENRSGVARAVNKFTKAVFTQGSAVGQAGRLRVVKQNLTVAEAMDYAVKQLDQGNAARDPAIEVELRETIGDTYLQLGLFPQAETQYRRVLALREQLYGPNHPNTRETEVELGFVLFRASKLAEAEAVLIRGRAGLEATVGPDDPKTLKAIHRLGVLYLKQDKHDEAAALLERAWKGLEAALGPDHDDTTDTLLQLSLIYLGRDVPQAERNFLRLVAVWEQKYGPDHPYTAQAFSGLGWVYREQKKYAEAEQYFRRAVEADRKNYTADHPESLTTAEYLGHLYSEMGRQNEAAEMFADVLARRERVLGPIHFQTLEAATYLAIVYGEQRNPAAIPLLVRVVAGRTEALGAGHPHTHLAVTNLANMCSQFKRYEMAVDVLARELARLEEAEGPDSLDTLDTARNLGVAYSALDRFDRAEPLLARALAGAEKLFEWNQPHPVTYRRELLDACQAAGRPDRAEPILRAWLANRERDEPDKWATYLTKCQLGRALLQQKKYAEAEPHLIDGYRKMYERAMIPPRTAPKLRFYEAATWAAELYDATNRPTEAAKWRATALKQSERIPPPRPGK